MSGAWEFIKRHKGKIIALGALTGAAAGSAYAYYTQQEAQQHLLSSLSENEFRFQPRRHFVFNAQQRACDKSIRDIVPNLSSLIEDRFPIEQLTEKLKQNSDMSVEEKVEIWEKIKVLSVARIMGVAYSYSLLTLALKSQISILAADICTEFERTICYTPTWLDTIKTQVENLLGYQAEPIRDPYIEVNSKQVASNRQVFIRCIEYLTTTGVAKLLSVIEETCKEFCAPISLTDRVNQDSLRDVLDQIDGKLSELEPCFFSKLVAPLSEEERVSEDGVLQLLTRLVKALESKECRETLVSLVDFYLTAAVHKAPEEPEVLAKLLPSMSDVYYFISTDGYDSPLQNSLCSSDVDNFAGFVFGLTKQPALGSALIAQYK
uniref:Peroxisomal biogenesis factor 3 n=1 Tax=Haemonchus contortus TaxID=6289 RepID=A0A7I4YNS7_HAECO